MPSAPGEPQNDTTDPLYDNADLKATNVTELHQQRGHVWSDSPALPQAQTSRCARRARLLSVR
jgi:hypothetical protein